MTATDPEPDVPRQQRGFAERRRARVAECDQRFEKLLEEALGVTGTSAAGVSIVAVGGYGRAELSPASDLDVLLVHDQRCPDVGPVAERLWYPMWDTGVRLDHSVRTVEETRDAADRDVRTALSLLDARHVAGDAALTLRLRTTLLADWRRQGPRRLRELETAGRERAAAAGELASLLEPDLKNAHGGLRDGVVLRAVAATWLVDVPQAQLARARADLLDVRDALHEVAGRRSSDRLLTEFQPDVARRLGLPGREALLRHVYAAARIVGYLGDLVWRRVAHALAARMARRPARPRRGPVLTPLARGVAAADGEVVLAADARPGRDPTLVLRTANAAATRGLPLSPYACGQLAKEAATLPTPWPQEARQLLTSLLGAGPALVHTWETLDQAGLVEVTVLPEWGRVRDRPQDSPVHRHTLDRHLLQTCVQASALVRRVSRPDLLLVAALLHDVGKGSSGDHSSLGAGIAEQVMTRWGYAPSDIARVVRLIQHHLLLVDTATRRDIDDPTTVQLVVDLVRDADLLELLAALTEADARATGPSAWTAWRAGLVSRLVDRVRGRLERRPAVQPSVLENWQLDLVRPARLDVVVDEAWGSKRVTVVAPDPTGVLAATAGVLAAAGVSIQSASLQTVRDHDRDVAITVWSVDGEPPPATVLREQLSSALAGRIDLDAALAARDAAYATYAMAGTPYAGPEADVRTVPDASASATVVEVRAHDRPGLFRRICVALAEQKCDVRSAHVSTWGSEVVDVFYLTGVDGAPLTEETAAEVAAAIRAAL